MISNFTTKHKQPQGARQSAPLSTLKSQVSRADARRPQRLKAQHLRREHVVGRPRQGGGRWEGAKLDRPLLLACLLPREPVETSLGQPAEVASLSPSLSGLTRLYLAQGRLVSRHTAVVLLPDARLHPATRAPVSASWPPCSHAVPSLVLVTDTAFQDTAI